MIKEQAIALIQTIPDDELDMVLSFIKGYTGTEITEEQEPLEALIYHMGESARNLARK